MGQETKGASKKVQPSMQDPVTCGDIIRLYLLANGSAAAKYTHLYKAIDQIGTWEDGSKEAFLAEFFPLAAMMDERCAEVVERLCKLQWVQVPVSVRPAFVDFLVSLAVIHIDNVHLVMRAATSQFLPSEQADVDQQEELYRTAHECIRRILDCNPRSALLLIEASEKNFPHVRLPNAKRFLGYVRNMLHLIDEHERLATPLWTLLIEKLVALEAISVESDPSCVKVLGDGDALPLVKDTSLRTKLELAMHLMLRYLFTGKPPHLKMFERVTDERSREMEAFDPGFKLIAERKMVRDGGKFLLRHYFSSWPAFVEQVLPVAGLQTVPILWLNLCTAEKSIRLDLFARLKELNATLDGGTTRSMNDTELRQNSADYLNSFRLDLGDDDEEEEEEGRVSGL